MGNPVLPVAVEQQLARAHDAGIDAPIQCGWLFTGTSLSVWQLAGAQADAITHQMPYAAAGAHYVSLMALDPAQPLRKLAVSLCSPDGNLSVWDDFSNPDCFQIRVPERVTAFASVSSGAAGGRTFLSVLGTADGGLHTVEVPKRGTLSRFECAILFGV